MDQFTTTTTTFGLAVFTDRGWNVVVPQEKTVLPTSNYIDPSAVAAAGVMDAGRPGSPPRGEPR